MAGSSTGSYHSTTSSRQSSLTIVNLGLRDDGLGAWSVVGLTICAAAGVAYAVNSWWAGLAALALLWLTIWRMFVPVQFEFGPLGVTEKVFRRRRRISWRTMEDIEIRKDGVVIVEYANQPFAKTYIRFAGQREAVLELLELYANVQTSGDESSS